MFFYFSNNDKQMSVTRFSLIIIIISIIVITFVIAYLIWHLTGKYKPWVFRFLRNIEIGTIEFINTKDQSKTIIVGTLLPDAYKTKVYVNDESIFYKEVATKGDIGLGYMYTQGVWTCSDLYAFMLILIINIDALKLKQERYASNYGSLEHDSKVIQHHYDIGNDFYETFLTDDLMAYSCGFWMHPSDTLNTAQYNKVHMIMRKLHIDKNDIVLDIGCGWGRIASYIQNKTKATVSGVTISKEQIDYNKTHNKNIDVHYGHYIPDSIDAQYTKIYSIGMFEHVRCMNYDTFFKKVYNALANNGRFLLHTITTSRNDTICREGSTKNFLTEYIFPGGQIPKIEWVLECAQRSGLKLVHMETIGGQHYAKTLNAWWTNIANSVDVLLQKGYSHATAELKL